MHPIRAEVANKGEDMNRSTLVPSTLATGERTHPFFLEGPPFLRAKRGKSWLVVIRRKIKLARHHSD